MIGSSNQFPPDYPPPGGQSWPGSIPDDSGFDGLPSLGSTPGVNGPLPGYPNSPSVHNGPPVYSGPPPVPGGPPGSGQRGFSATPGSQPFPGGPQGGSHQPPPVPGQNRSATSPPASIPGFRNYSHQAELYAELFGVAPAPKTANGPTEKRPNRLTQAQAPPPTSPRSLKESGLTLSQACDLVLKQLYLHGSLLGVDIARNARLPFNVIDECLRFLKDDHAIEVTSGDIIGRVSYRFHLTDLGRSRAKEAFEFCRYVGPAPVPLEEYVEQCRRQAVTGINCTPAALLEGFSELVIPPALVEELGPAVCTGRSVFLYGPPGNGK